ncbi:MAG: hypothetical protein K2L82_13045 [Lachnospiraceae bacterium]|nr:hypothetical protein [Lachnospiraceae bacterium]
MEFVKSVDEIRQNMKTLDSYIGRRMEPEYSYALSLIQRGACFATVKSEDGYRFYPSRFIGYAHNDRNKHQNNPEKDGRKTNRVIFNILRQEASPQLELEAAYIKYCEQLGFTVHHKERKYWLL